MKKERKSEMWRDKANQVMSYLCYNSWLAANTAPNGKRYKKHRPYTVPDEARELADCLGDPDQKRGEIRAKEIMMALRNAGHAIDQKNA